MFPAFRFKADSNIQKALGLVTDTIGFVSLLIMLSKVGVRCHFGNGWQTWQDMKYIVYPGPGFFSYLFCLFAAFLRTFFHWFVSSLSTHLARYFRALHLFTKLNPFRRLTPTPKVWRTDSKTWCLGNCCCNVSNMVIPPEILEQIGREADAELSCADTCRLMTYHDKMHELHGLDSRPRELGYTKGKLVHTFSHELARSTGRRSSFFQSFSQTHSTFFSSFRGLHRGTSHDNGEAQEVGVSLHSAITVHGRPLREGDRVKIVKEDSHIIGEIVEAIDPDWNGMVKVRRTNGDLKSYNYQDVELVQGDDEKTVEAAKRSPSIPPSVLPQYGDEAKSMAMENLREAEAEATSAEAPSAASPETTGLLVFCGEQRPPGRWLCASPDVPDVQVPDGSR